MNGELKIFYSHSIYKYDTDIEKMEIQLLEKAFPYADIINPNQSVEDDRPEQEIMKDCVNAIKDCDALAFSTVSGLIGAGVLEELETAFKIGILVFEIADYTLYNIDGFNCNLTGSGNRREYAVIRTERKGVHTDNCDYVFMPDGKHECDTRIYTHRQVFENVTVEILEDDSGYQSIGWYRQDNTIELDDFGDEVVDD